MINAFARKFSQFLATRNMKRFLKPQIWLGLVCGILVLLLIVYPAQSQKPDAQQSQKSLIIATRAIPPFVFTDKGELSGFSVELWRNIASLIGAEFKFVEYPNVADLLLAVESGKADAGIAAISITAERQQKFDFSLPMFTGGLQILIRNTKLNTAGTPNILSLFFSPALFQVFGLALLLIVIAAHVIWLSERHHPEEMIPKSYFPGIFKACWWAAATLATQADEMPKGVMGRVLAIIWMFIGVLFVAYFTAAATTSLTVQQLQGDINSVEDLPGKLVATTTGSTAAKYLKEHKISVLEVAKIEQAYNALETGKTDAVVFDSPVLLFYSANQGQGQVEVVGSVFREENYGIVLPNNSPYRKPINSALLKLRENGTYQALYDKWFSVKKNLN
ncbi:transporter substrate-binding domain-containing protein [Nostoc sp. FACHB-152]|uniref:transporter substrate-binding domain-containing protein n=1 Tax=unclassified Nostoc TaxID=2593658 RepID=UPI001685A530|nr:MULTISPECIES: transporter substrate-binding domain-containing protein [unclassified Nostoc]MBD2446999.1 transporter substrate-binding domain-containing protein [Nostoc sp. FACHB-152]MBD2467664.1 transporter substrate-binding domain-containing protein [Nostoc sp. FACHB-145]